MKHKPVIFRSGLLTEEIYSDLTKESFHDISDGVSRHFIHGMSDAWDCYIKHEKQSVVSRVPMSVLLLDVYKQLITLECGVDVYESIVFHEECLLLKKHEVYIK